MTTAVMCLVLALWPLIAFLGGAAFSMLVGAAAVATLGASLPRVRPRVYTFAVLAFFVFAAGSTMWSPHQTPLIDFSEGAAVSEVPRIGLLFLATGALIAAMQGLSDQSARLVMRVAMVAFILQVVSIVVVTIFEREAIAFFYPGGGEDNGVQNISRNSLMMVAAFPFLAADLLEGRNRVLGLAAAATLLVVECWVLLYRGVDAGVLAIAAAAASYVIIRRFPRQGFRIIAAVIVAVILSAPLVFHFVSAGVDPATTGSSMGYRQLIWGRVLEIIAQNPVFGDGVGALRSYRDTIEVGPFAGELYVPNHAHNMALQLWAETGLVGALLLSAAIMLLAFRLPQPAALGSTATRIAALAGVVVAIGMVSFDLWNVTWWGVVSILAVLCAVHARTRPIHQS